MLGFSLLGSCYFPNDSYVNPAIRPPGVVQAGLDIENLSDPYSLVYPTTFAFNVITGGKRIMIVEVLKDGNPWIQSSRESVNFDLDPAEYSDGTHEILIKVRLSSGSGSVAELLQAEYYEFEKAFTFTVDKSPPQPVSGITIAMEDGKLVLRWDKPDHNHFEYVIHRTYWYGENSASQKFIRIKDPSTTEYVDDGFTGGNIIYSISLESPSFSVGSVDADFKLQPVVINATMNDDNVVRISWAQPYYFGDSIYVAVTRGDQRTQFPAQAGEMAVDTLILGDQIPVSFKIIREGYEPEGYQKDFTFRPGLPIKAFDDIHLLPSNKLILTKVIPEDRRTRIYRYDASSMLIEDSLTLEKPSSGLLVSADGNLTYVLHYENLERSEVLLIKFNPLNFSEPTSTISLPPSYDGNYLITTKNFSLSNGNILLFEDARFNGPRVIQVDLNSNSVIWSRSNVDNPVLSPDGSTLVVRDGGSGQVWKKDQSNWVLSANVPAGNFYFTSGTTQMLIVSTPSFTGIYDPNDTSGGSVLQPLRTSAAAVTGYDRITNNLISEEITADHISVIKVLNTDLIEKFAIRANVFHNYPDYKHVYTGSAHYLSSGFMAKTEL